jgi:hypothetical protein
MNSPDKATNILHATKSGRRCFHFESAIREVSEHPERVLDWWFVFRLESLQGLLINFRIGQDQPSGRRGNEGAELDRAAV